MYMAFTFERYNYTYICLCMYNKAFSLCRDLRTLDPTWVRSNVIGYINQEPILFATSIIENIRYGRLSATDEEVQPYTTCIIML